LERAFDGIELAADAADPIEQLLLVLESVRHFPLDPILQGSIYADTPDVEPARAGVFGETSPRDPMNPRPSDAPSEDHGRSATVTAAGSIARETREVPEKRSA
jgi:hypothetical protein